MRAKAVDEFIKGLEEGCRRGPERHRLEPAMFRSPECWPDGLDCADEAAVSLRDLFTDPNPGPSSLLWVEQQLNDDLFDAGDPLYAVTEGDAVTGMSSGGASSRYLRQLTGGERSQRSNRAEPSAR